MVGSWSIQNNIMYHVWNSLKIDNHLDIHPNSPWGLIGVNYHGIHLIGKGF